MSKRRHRFQAPPAHDPLHGARSSLVFRLNFGFFFRQLGIFLVMDLLLVIMATTGLFLWAENRCADVVALVLPHSPQTVGLMDEGRIAKMKDDAILLSCGRGSVAEVAASVGLDVRDPAFWRQSLDQIAGMIDRFDQLV